MEFMLLIMMACIGLAFVMNFADGRSSITIDDDLIFKAAGAIAASAAVATIIDVGAGLFRGVMQIDVSTLVINDNNEIYDIVIQGSPDADFGTDTNIKDLASITLCAAEVQRSDSNLDSVIGRKMLYFSNEMDSAFYRYLRIYTVVAGTSPSINYTAAGGKL